MRALTLALVAVVGSGLGASTAAWRSAIPAPAQEPPAATAADVELPDYSGLEEYRLEDFVFKGAVTAAGESGAYRVTYEAEDLFQVNFLQGSAELEIPDLYTYMAARSQISVEGSWTRSERHETSSGVMQDTFQMQTPMAAVTRTFSPRAMRQILEDNRNGFDDNSWYTNSAVVVQVQDARLWGGDVTYTVVLGGHDGSSDQLQHSPPTDAIRNVVAGGPWRWVRDHHHEVPTGRDPHEEYEFDPTVVATVIGVEGSFSTRRNLPGGIADTRERRAVNFQPTHPFLVGDYATSVEIAPFNAYDNGPETANVHVSWMLGARADTQALLTAVDETAEQLPPEPGEIREYRLTVPRGLNVQGARFRLEDVTEIPGIATNAGNHIRYIHGLCPHCGNEVTPVPYDANPELFHGQVLVRDYEFYSACPVDRAPDYYFRADENVGYELGPEADGGRLGELAYRAGISLSRTGEALEEYVVRLTVADWGGTARLRAEFLIGDAWLPATAEGPTAAGDALLIGNDRDGDLISDGFEDNAGRDLDPAEDVDAIPAASEPGDGLSAHEEYRGVYVVGLDGTLGVHERLDPTIKDLFVHDYSWQLADNLTAVRQDFEAQTGMRVWELEDIGFVSEIVNFWEEAPHRNGAQFSLVLMENPVRPADVGFREFYDSWAFWGGRAAHVGPPTAANHTIVIQHSMMQHDDYLRRAIAHEIGHNINLPHHGDTAHVVTDPDDANTRYFAAVPGGQLSGASGCIMRYRSADLFCDQVSPLSCVGDWSFVTYACSAGPFTASQLCSAWSPGPEYLCTAAAGTGVNASGAWSGDALNGNCMSRIRIRSY